MQRVRAPTGLHLAYVARAEHPAHWDDVLGIATFKLPERLEIRSELPRNPLGKILKRELRDELRQ